MSNDDINERPYQVGRGKPPLEHQFPKGKSGNLRGRPRKAARSLTERQPVFDILKVATKEVRVRRGGEVVKTTVAESIWESLAAKAASGHGPSQRYFLKEYKHALSQIPIFYPKFSGIIRNFENELDNGNFSIHAEARENLDYVRRVSNRVIDGHDERKDPYVKKQKREATAYFARQSEREARGIRRASVDAIDGIIVLKDPGDGRALRIESNGFLELRIALKHRYEITAASLAEHLWLDGHSYDEAVAFLRQKGVKFTEF